MTCYVKVIGIQYCVIFKGKVVNSFTDGNVAATVRDRFNQKIAEILLHVTVPHSMIGKRTWDSITRYLQACRVDVNSNRFADVDISEPASEPE